MQESLEADLIQKLNQYGNQLQWLSHTNLKMTMIPSVGFFIVVVATAAVPEHYDELVEKLGKLNWKFCFEQGGSTEKILYFQNELTEEFDQTYGDLYS